MAEERIFIGGAEKEQLLIIHKATAKHMFSNNSTREYRKSMRTLHQEYSNKSMQEYRKRHEDAAASCRETATRYISVMFLGQHKIPTFFNVSAASTPQTQTQSGSSSRKRTALVDGSSSESEMENGSSGDEAGSKYASCDDTDEIGSNAEDCVSSCYNWHPLPYIQNLVSSYQ